MPVSVHLLGGVRMRVTADITFVATRRLSAADSVGPSPTVTAGTVEHFAIIGKITWPRAVDRAMIESIAACARRGDARNRTMSALPGVNTFALGYGWFSTG